MPLTEIEHHEAWFVSILGGAEYPQVLANTSPIVTVFKSTTNI